MDDELLNEEARRMAVSRLAGRPLSQVGDQLFHALADPNWRIRKEAIEVLLTCELTSQEIDRLVDALGDDGNAGIRNAAAELLQRLGSRVVPRLLESISGEDPERSKFVVDVLGAIGDRQALPLLRRLVTDRDPNVASAAVEAIGKIGDQESVDTLLAAVDTSNLPLAFTILDALGQIGAPIPRHAIERLLEKPLLRKAVFDCLGSTGTIAELPHLIGGLSDKSRVSRESALAAIVKMHDRLSPEELGSFHEAVRQLAGTPLMERLIASLESVDDSLRIPLIRLIGLSRDHRGVIPLLRLSSRPDLSAPCRRAIAEIGQTAVSTLSSFFAYGSDEEQVTIIELCAEMGNRSCGDLLVEGAASRNPEVRAAAIRAIGELGLGDLVETVIAALDDVDPTVAETAVTTLVLLAPCASGPIREEGIRRFSSDDVSDRLAAAHLLMAVGERHLLSILLKDEEAVVRAGAITALSSAPSPATGALLVRSLIDEDPDVRLAAVKGVARVGGEGAVAALHLLLNDDDQRVVRTVLQVLGTLRDPSSIQPLAVYMKNASGMMLIMAMESLAAVAGAEASCHLERFLEHPDEEVVKTAVSLLSAVGPERLMERKELLLSHPHWEVRSRTIRALADLMGGDARTLLETIRTSEDDPLVLQELDRIVARMS